MQKTMLRTILIILVTLGYFKAAAQETITLSSKQIESLFLKQNIELIAYKLNISIADAAIAQAKVWENPEFSISDINFWKKNGDVPYQFSVELTQMVSLSASKSKLRNLEKVGKDIAVKEFEELLRGLKFELRKSINEIVHLQERAKIAETEKNLLEEIIKGYQFQYEKGNISKNELIRLQTALFAVEGELAEINTYLNASYKIMKNLIFIEPNSKIILVDSPQSLPLPISINPNHLIEIALKLRPDINISELQLEYHKKDITYQKSLSIPNLSMGLKYDQNGGVWNKFVGVGVGIEVPIFNRNQGEIKKAKINLQQSQLNARKESTMVKNEIIEAYENYVIAYLFAEKGKTNPALSELDGMLGIYSKNLLAKNISMVEFVDFMQSYRSSKEMLLKAQIDVSLSFEQLQFSVGQDIL